MYCPEDEIPLFKNSTEAGTTNYLELKISNPEDWNSFRKRIMYTCPVGFVIERPAGQFGEQQDPIPPGQETFEVECGKFGRWEPRPYDDGTYMPYCIRKLISFIPPNTLVQLQTAPKPPTQ